MPTDVGLAAAPVPTPGPEAATEAEGGHQVLPLSKENRVALVQRINDALPGLRRALPWPGPALLARLFLSSFPGPLPSRNGRRRAERRAE
jgi:hypothetical protein